MKLILLMTLSLCSFLSFSQDYMADMELLKAKTASTEIPAKPLKGLLKVYNKVVSEQILNDCIYEHSCSTFSQGSIDEFGVIKGLVLTGDRLMRCNRASAINVAPVRFTDDGKIKDHWNAYSRSK